MPRECQVFINPCTKDVIATSTAEALAMGKWVLLPDAPCNHFFASFPNALIYQTPSHFSRLLDWALAHEPGPLSDKDIW